jgi:hypothetical protein
MLGQGEKSYGLNSRMVLNENTLGWNGEQQEFERCADGAGATRTYASR